MKKTQLIQQQQQTGVAQGLLGSQPGLRSISGMMLAGLIAGAIPLSVAEAGDEPNRCVNAGGISINYNRLAHFHGWSDRDTFHVYLPSRGILRVRTYTANGVKAFIKSANGRREYARQEVPGGNANLSADLGPGTYCIKLRSLNSTPRYYYVHPIFTSW